MKLQLLPRQQTPQPINSPKRILLVEDNDINRLLMSDYLNFCAYEVLTLPQASDFFAAVEKFQPHLILLDLKLPGIDGFSLLEQMQQKPNWQHIPIFVVSAFAFRADRERAMHLGAKHYFVKPVNLSHFRQAIEQELTQ